MSHTSTIRSMNIRSTPAIRHAVAELKREGVNCDLVENAKPRMYYSSQGEVCDFVIKLHDGKYDVGLKKDAEGNYEIMLDTWGGHVSGQIGADVAMCPLPGTEEGRTQHAVGRFAHHYNKKVAIDAAIAAGHSVNDVHVDDQGRAHIRVGVNA